jgi:hypothetical protein
MRTTIPDIAKFPPIEERFVPDSYVPGVNLVTAQCSSDTKAPSVAL